ncbi:MAG: glycosyltransferase [bacterium]
MVDLTVVVPVYNEEEILKKQLETMMDDLEEMEIKYELRVVENGSVDDTWEILEKVRRNHPEVIKSDRLEQANLGPARSTGIRQAKGEFVFISDIDYWLPEFVQSVWERRNEADYFVGIKGNEGRGMVRRCMKRIKNLVFRWMFGVPYSDISHVLFGRTNVLKRELEQCRVNHAILILELLTRLYEQGNSFQEVPIEKPVSEIRPPRLTYFWKWWYSASEFLRLFYHLRIREG